MKEKAQAIAKEKLNAEKAEDGGAKQDIGKAAGADGESKLARLEKKTKKKRKPGKLPRLKAASAGDQSGDSDEEVEVAGGTFQDIRDHAKKKEVDHHEWRKELMTQYRSKLANVQTNFAVRGSGRNRSSEGTLQRIKEWQGGKVEALQRRHRGNVSPYLVEGASPDSGSPKTPKTPKTPKALTSAKDAAAGGSGMKASRALRRRTALQELSSKADIEADEKRRQRATEAAKAAAMGLGDKDLDDKLTGSMLSRRRSQTFATVAAFSSRASRNSLGFLSGKVARLRERLSMGM